MNVSENETKAIYHIHVLVIFVWPLLMEVAASGALGFTAVYTAVDSAPLKHYGLKVIAKVEECGSDFYVVTAERRLKHPAAVAITEHAYSQLFARAGARPGELGSASLMAALLRRIFVPTKSTICDRCKSVAFAIFF